MELSRRERNKQLCRARILKASRRLFSTKGYEQTTMEDVAQRAEVSKATLYNYFVNKESLLLGIAEAELDEIRQLTETELRGEPSAVVKLRRVLKSFFRDSVRYINLTRRITCLNSNPDSELFGTRQQMLSLFQGLVEEGQRNGELCKRVPAEDVVELLMGVYLVSQFHWTDVEEDASCQSEAQLDRLFDHMLADVLVTGDGN